MNEFDSLLRKKLLLLITGTSAGLAIDDHHLRHFILTSELELVLILTCLDTIANFFRAAPATGRDPAPVSARGAGFCLRQLPEAPIFQYWGSSVNLKWIVNGRCPTEEPIMRKLMLPDSVRARAAGVTLVFAILFAFSAWTFEIPTLAQPRVDALREHVRYLASDELTGRGVETPGIKLARDYIRASLPTRACAQGATTALTCRHLMSPPESR